MSDVTVTIQGERPEGGPYPVEYRETDDIMGLIEDYLEKFPQTTALTITVTPLKEGEWP